jgi:hypothetical protein
MWHQPVRPAKAPTRESFHLGIARAAYVNGALTIEEFEQSVGHVLRGGHLNAAGRIPEPGELPSLPDPDLVAFAGGFWKGLGG